MPLEENVGDIGIVSAVELAARRYVCHRVLEWTDLDDTVQLAVASFPVCQRRSIQFTLWNRSTSFGFWKVTSTCGRTVARKTCVEERCGRSSQGAFSGRGTASHSKETDGIGGAIRTLGPRTPRRMDATIDGIGTLRSQERDVKDTAWLEHLRLAAASFGPVPHGIKSLALQTRSDGRGKGNNAVLHIFVARSAAAVSVRSGRSRFPILSRDTLSST